MPRLINYGLGEVLDRLTVLSLKILYGEITGRAVKHWRDERNVLLTKVPPQLNAGATSWVEKSLTLAAVNAAIWATQDQMRAFAAAPAGTVDPKIIAEVALQTFRLNDQRTVLMDEINALTGSYQGPEKGDLPLANGKGSER